MQTTRDNARFLREVKRAHFLWPVLGNQPGAYAALDALSWENTPVAAATTGTRPGPDRDPHHLRPPRAGRPGLPARAASHPHGRYVTVKKNGQWVMRNCETVLYLTSLHEAETSPADLLACVRGHWTVEHLHWRRDLAGGQIPPPYRKRSAGDVRPHQPRHHPVPHTRSNQGRRRRRTPARCRYARAPPAPAGRLASVLRWRRRQGTTPGIGCDGLPGGGATSTAPKPATTSGKPGNHEDQGAKPGRSTRAAVRRP
jgi:hypothetical protein